MDMEESQCDAALKPPIQEYCNVHNPCPGDGKSASQFVSINKIVFPNLCVLLCFKVSSRKDCDLPFVLVWITFIELEYYTSISE